MPLAAPDFYNSQVDVLNAVTRIVREQSPLDVPDRLYTSVGLAAHDCDQITVSASAAPIVMAGSRGSALDRIDTRFPVQHAFAFRIELVRCWPVVREGGNAPSTDTLEQFSYAVNTEGWLVYYALVEQQRLGILFPESTAWCRKFRVTQLSPIDPSGGVAGWIILAQADIA